MVRGLALYSPGGHHLHCTLNTRSFWVFLEACLNLASRAALLWPTILEVWSGRKPRPLLLLRILAASVFIVLHSLMMACAFMAWTVSASVLQGLPHHLSWSLQLMWPGYTCTTPQGETGPAGGFNPLLQEGEGMTECRSAVEVAMKRPVLGTLLWARHSGFQAAQRLY